MCLSVGERASLCSVREKFSEMAYLKISAGFKNMDCYSLEKNK